MADTTTVVPASWTRSPAFDLLCKLDATGWFTRAQLAAALQVTDEALAEQLADEQPMPLERQLMLAHFVLAQVPVFARRARRLKGQVEATLAFHARASARVSSLVITRRVEAAVFDRRPKSA